MPIDASTHQPGMGPPGRRDVILQLLRTSAEPRSIASVADELGVHPNTVRFHLDALLRAGRVDQVLGDSAGRGRPPILFRASRRMDPTGPTNYRLLASILTGYVAGRPDAAGIAAALGRSTSPALVASSRSAARRRKPARSPNWWSCWRSWVLSPNPPTVGVRARFGCGTVRSRTWPNNTAR